MDDELYKKVKDGLVAAFESGTEKIKSTWTDDDDRAQYMLGLAATAEALMKLEAQKQADDRKKRKPSSLKTTL